MLETKEVEICLMQRNTRFYENKGYEIPKIKNIKDKLIYHIGSKIKIKVEDISDGSNVLVDVRCDGCKKLLKGIKWLEYKKHVKEDKKYYCKKCASNNYKKWTSFYDWCYENLDKEEATNIIERWDYEKNIDKKGNIIDPQDITYKSNGLNKKGYWFKCLDYLEHGSEQKHLKIFTNKQKRYLKCDICNSIAITYPDLVKFLVNKDDAYKYSYGTSEKILMKCPDCGCEKLMLFSNLRKQGFGCPKCSDGVSYPQKFMFNILEQLNLDFKIELSKKDFRWCKNYRYDFYIEKINCIIETHGMQHYEEGDKYLGKLYKNQQNDKCKEQLAKVNNILNYIIIDCRKSDMNWIKNNIINSILPTLLNFKEEDIDWLKCHEYACNSLLKEACDLWNSGINNTQEIAKILKKGKGTIITYLKQGAELKWCDYDPNEASRKNYILMVENKSRKIICLTTEEIFDSIIEASHKYKIKQPNISMCCSGKRNYAGKHPETEEKLVWMYYEDYINKNQILERHDNYIRIKIICITTGEIFTSIHEAKEKYKIDSSAISKCCRNKQGAAGRHPTTNKKMVWMYYEDYLKQPNNNLTYQK